MPLIYAFVARETAVLADHTGPQFTGNFKSVAVQCLDRVPSGNNKFTFTANQHSFNFLIDGGYTFLVVADEGFGRQVPFAFLENVKNEFNQKYAEKSRTAQAGSLDRAFGPRLKYHMDYCMEHPEELSKVAGLQKKVDEVKNVMVDNIEQVLARGERIENLVDKTDNLRNQADRFHRTGVALRRKMWWQHKKMWLIVILIILILALVIFLSVCFSGGNCFKN
ncbi:R-SNARE protein, VAMP72-family [Coccomyxa subellipsoidea C-169]|uniref:R-SNARE protein, VAMP72-family n=1 Tax=Coccomyxa subellipsoidea (strain C-169) TaxID=574566 RepID=I0YZT1_COCSC|nr:R-SNARE protein, VAMP72-family [Coccomyxa subellipsoidea C-169]EIE23900.1 R-SNARE protein, VAMP72-family [Coccomyxa subellipsoidea C-169]|eukprot:XP_005648444.1 R-SNARE protein, VAMP72-family [Coccomyxa subellipsoidea C-169]